MIRHAYSGPLFYLLMVFVLMGCKGASGGEEVKKESWQMNDDVALTQIGPLEEEAFWQAALDGELERVKALLKQGVMCDAVDQDGHTALMLAAYNGHSEIVRILLDAGCTIDQRDSMDRTALLYGATGPFPETVEMLLDNGAEPDMVDSDEHFSALMHAAAEGNLNVVKVLIRHGADRALKDVDGDDAASFAAQAGHMEVVAYLKSLE
jgi:ankyrin repeat protein